MVTHAVYGVLGLVDPGIPVNLIWRVLSHRQILPCPSRPGWLVELDNVFTRVNRAQFNAADPGAGAGHEGSGCRMGFRLLDGFVLSGGPGYSRIIDSGFSRGNVLCTYY